MFFSCALRTDTGKLTYTGNKLLHWEHSLCCCLVTKLCEALCDPMNCSTPGLPVHPQLPESLLKLMSIESVMPSNHLILCHSLLLLPSIFHSIRGFSKESVQFSSVAQSCPTLCDPMNRSTPGLPVHHHLPESVRRYYMRDSGLPRWCQW